MKRIILYLCIVSLLLANSPREWLHWDHHSGECEAGEVTLCEEADQAGHCSHEAHFSQEPHSCLLLQLSSKYQSQDLQPAELVSVSTDSSDPICYSVFSIQRPLVGRESRGPPSA